MITDAEQEILTNLLKKIDKLQARMDEVMRLLKKPSYHVSPGDLAFLMEPYKIHTRETYMIVDTMLKMQAK